MSFLIWKLCFENECTINLIKRLSIAFFQTILENISVDFSKHKPKFENIWWKCDHFSNKVWTFNKSTNFFQDCRYIDYYGMHKNWLPFQLSSHPWAFDLVVCRLKLSFTNVFNIFISLKYRNNRLITILRSWYDFTLLIVRKNNRCDKHSPRCLITSIKTSTNHWSWACSYSESWKYNEVKYHFRKPVVKNLSLIKLKHYL